MTVTPAVDGWFTDGPAPALLASRCTTCATPYFPPLSMVFCRNPECEGAEFEVAELSRRGRVWSYTDAQYQPPAPYIAAEGEYEPFALAAVELPEGLVVLGQVASGFGVADLSVGAEVEIVVETLYVDDSGERTSYRWRPVGAPTGSVDAWSAQPETAQPGSARPEPAQPETAQTQDGA